MNFTILIAQTYFNKKIMHYDSHCKKNRNINTLKNDVVGLYDLYMVFLFVLLFEMELSLFV